MIVYLHLNIFIQSYFCRVTYLLRTETLSKYTEKEKLVETQYFQAHEIFFGYSLQVAE